MEQTFVHIRDPMTNWRWDNSCAFKDPVDHINLQKTCSGMVKLTSYCISWYRRNDLRAKIELQSFRQYMPGVILPNKQLNWDEIIDEDDDVENWAYPRVPSHGRFRPGDGNNTDNGEGEKDLQGGENRTKKRKGTTNGHGQVMGMGKGNRNGTGNVIQTPAGDDISRAVALPLQKEMYHEDSDTDG